MKKRVLAMVMALCLALSLLPVTAGAVETGTDLVSISSLVASSNGTYDDSTDTEHYATNAAHVQYEYYSDEDKMCFMSGDNDNSGPKVPWVKSVTITGISFGELSDDSEDMQKLQAVIRNARRTDHSPSEFKDSIQVNFVNCTFNQTTTHFQVYKIRPCDASKYTFTNCTFNQQNDGQYAITLNASESGFTRSISYEIVNCTINSNGRGINVTSGTNGTATDPESWVDGIPTMTSIVISGNTFNLPKTSASNMAIQIAGVWDKADLTEGSNPPVVISDNEIDAYVAVRVHDSMGKNSGDSAKYLAEFSDNVLLNGTIGIVAETGDSDNATAMIQAIADSYTSSSETSFIIPATGITLSQSNATLYSNGTPNTVTLTAIVIPTDSNETVTWRSSNTGVATVVNGVVTAVGNGTAIITAEVGDYSATCAVNVTTYSNGSSGSSSSTTYSPTLDVSDGGSIKVSPRTPEAGDEVTITPDPDSGYEVDQVTVTDRDGDEIRVTANRDGTYTFTQPRGRVTIEVTFVRETGETTFSDVPETYWAYDEIEWAYDNGYVNGTSASTFAPGASISRQQVWMILARLSGGSPADMAAAREWAMANDISDGTNPGNAVTRQQLAALLFRFAQANGYDSGDRAALTGFPDAGSVASYAVEALQWATASGIINGTSQGTLNPAGTATRAQFAVMLYRFWNGL